MPVSRRRMMAWCAASVAARAQKLPLEEYVPKSMLHVAQTRVERARFPLVDVHTHLTWVDT
ncbi:MAG: hypothetical protein ACRD96_23750, partial [Bryobacteraceae bacterium]